MKMTEVQVLSREEILGINDKEIILVEVPAWEKITGKKVAIYMKSWTASERDSWEAEMYAGRNEMKSMFDFRAKLVSRTICDAEGNLLFTQKDVKALGAKSAKALDFLFEKAQQLNGMKKEDIEELTANLPEGQTED
jgi:hypothetical protein